MSDKKNKLPLVIHEVTKALDRDVLSMPTDLLREELAQRGMNYDAEVTSGKAFVQGLLRERKRTVWMKRADMRHQAMTRKLEQSGDWIRRRAQELLDAGHPGLQAAFRDRKPGEMTEEELRTLAEEQALAELLEEDENG